MSYSGAKRLDKSRPSCVLVNHNPEMEPVRTFVRKDGFVVLASELGQPKYTNERAEVFCRELGFRHVSRLQTSPTDKQDTRGNVMIAYNLELKRWQLEAISPEAQLFNAIVCTTEEAGECNRGDYNDPDALQGFFTAWFEYIWVHGERLRPEVCQPDAP